MRIHEHVQRDAGPKVTCIVGGEFAINRVQHPTAAMGVANVRIQRKAIIRFPGKTQQCFIGRTAEFFLRKPRRNTGTDDFCSVRAIGQFTEPAAVYFVCAIAKAAAIIPTMRKIIYFRAHFRLIEEGPTISQECTAAHGASIAVVFLTQRDGRAFGAQIFQPLRGRQIQCIAQTENIIAANETKIGNVEFLVEVVQREGMLHPPRRGVLHIRKAAVAVCAADTATDQLRVQLERTVAT